MYASQKWHVLSVLFTKLRILCHMLDFNCWFIETYLSVVSQRITSRGLRIFMEKGEKRIKEVSMTKWVRLNRHCVHVVLENDSQTWYIFVILFALNNMVPITWNYGQWFVTQYCWGLYDQSCRYSNSWKVLNLQLN